MEGGEGGRKEKWLSPPEKNFWRRHCKPPTLDDGNSIWSSCPSVENVSCYIGGGGGVGLWLAAVASDRMREH